jgi:hypothetical protein
MAQQGVDGWSNVDGPAEAFLRLFQLGAVFGKGRRHLLHPWISYLYVVLSGMAREPLSQSTSQPAGGQFRKTKDGQATLQRVKGAARRAAMHATQEDKGSPVHVDRVHASAKPISMGEQLLAAAAARRDEPVKIWSLNGKQYPSVDAAFAAALGFQRSANCKPYWQLVEFEMSEEQGKRQMLMKCSICGTYYKYSNMAQWAKMHFTEDFSGCKGNKRAAAAPADPSAA